ncbi:uncharacterized protein ARMOST_21674 [Armillaria ostoyae]|uniref:Uncharacterized protein n=1 Tax=Armillaria ostoyae TaxID=47428 RepID=A0A284SAR9_ARMOS|nr:uncharacterized protein ARMOST_21674 [Armillaria ostoyae]
MRFLLGPLTVEVLEVRTSMVQIWTGIRPFSSLEELVLDLLLSQDIHQKLLQLSPAFPLLTSEISLGVANRR